MLMFNNTTEKQNVIVDMAAYDVKMRFNYTYIEYYSSLVTPIKTGKKYNK